jgi:hypothetical protein
MRALVRRAACATFLALALTSAAVADCCDTPTIVYGAGPAVVTLPPTGYVLDPSDARRPVYIVNQGPEHGAWIGAIAQPTYSEGGYAYIDECPVDVVPAPRHYPYVRSLDGGRRFDAPRHGFRQPHARPFADAAWGGPAAAYRYRPAPDARIINVPPREVLTMHTSYRPR